MEKSSVLQYILNLAARLKDQDGKKFINANYFILAILEANRLYKENKLPQEMSSAKSKIELMIAVKALQKYNINLDSVALNIRNGVGDDYYVSSIDDFIFSKLEYTAENKATAEGKSCVNLNLLLDTVLSEPTALIKEHLISASTDVPAETESAEVATGEEPAASSETTVDTDVDALKAFFEMKAEDAAKKAESTGAKEAKASAKRSSPTATAAKDEDKGRNEISSTVEATQKIQKYLLDNVFGQDLAVDTFVSGYFQSEIMRMSKLSKKKPKATFLFAGPPGVGKTFLAETAAEALGLPFMRFDMSEYCNKESDIEFAGSDKVYKNGKAGNVTSFVQENPKCVLLFDEIEKAHLVVIHLFLQILDAGRLRDNYTDEEISFEDVVIILTTNAGKNLYEDPTIPNLSAIPRKKIIKALSTDMNPVTNAPLFPAAICSRFASGNVVMFNHLVANNLYVIANKELSKNIKAFEKNSKISIEVDNRVSTAIMLAEGGKADARTVKGRANAFFYDELYELFRLLGTDKYKESVPKVKNIKINVKLDDAPEAIRKLFICPESPSVLVFGDADLCKSCQRMLIGATVFSAGDIETAKDILFREDISVILCDVKHGMIESDDDVLNIEDAKSLGADFLSYALATHSVPAYLIQENEGDITDEEFLSFAKNGVIDLITLNSEANGTFNNTVLAKCDIAYQQANMNKLARENKILSYKTSQTISQNRRTASINLFDFRLSLATDMEDSGNILDSVSKPNLRFDDVIGAEDAKRELTYFVEYLKNPVKYMRRGLRAPKGILLYGPPGTGKTLLAKAMAGESDVTFITAEGNQFLKRYVGEGSDAVHALFNSARKYAPSILFIDEIDAIGKNRNSSGTTDTGDVLTAFLTEMDGFNTDTTKPVFVLAATNYAIDQNSPKSLDPALLRRFDRKIFIDLPDKSERKRFLEMKIRKKPVLKITDGQIENLAIRSTGMSLAELDSVIEFALRNAFCNTDACQIGDEALEEAFETYNSGEKKEWSSDTLLRTARHEAGHALLCWLSGDKPAYITIVSRANHGGYMQHGDNEDKMLYTRAELLSRIRTSLAGRAAEIVYYGDQDGITTGASSDIYNATRIAAQMICDYGMDEEMGIPYMDEGSLPSEYYTRVHDRIKELLQVELNNAISLISDNRFAVNEMVDALLTKNHLKSDEIDEIFRRTTI